MTAEQPPSAEALHVAETFVDTVGRWRKLAHRIDALCEQRVSAVASGHQAALAAAQYEAQRWKDVAAKKYSIDDLSQHREEGRQEVLARLQEPDVQKAVADIIRNKNTWNAQSTDLADAVIARIKEMLK